MSSPFTSLCIAGAIGINAVAAVTAAHTRESAGFGDSRYCVTAGGDSITLPASIASFSTAELRVILDSIQNADPGIYPDVSDFLYALFGDTEGDTRNEALREETARHAAGTLPEGSADAERARYRLKTAMTNRPGAKANDFRMSVRGKGSGTLYGCSTPDALLVVFYDPDCDECRGKIGLLAEETLAKRLTVLAVDISGDKDRWESGAIALPDTWIDAFALEDLEDNGTYDFPKTPVIFLLGKDKTVMLKEASLRQLRESPFFC